MLFRTGILVISAVLLCLFMAVGAGYRKVSPAWSEWRADVVASEVAEEAREMAELVEALPEPWRYLYFAVREKRTRAMAELTIRSFVATQAAKCPRLPARGLERLMERFKYANKDRWARVADSLAPFVSWESEPCE